ncbi:MAG: hypothetical protein JRN26_04830 [Nitrososphaerota archaeon]|jgi:hypothetical protein|nr:hypothetical protein [Nitrososphaerota archaeon]MDG6927440.1 hypothetical protein [Nitrososphaerota archaeon]MDG6930083.1 hypothetical protein [Nitrososphaerota archaeon]MDG6932995.1 hypothetical protein [Nitrososphaerota archaeon]MDG6936189.1 hypothetical protein [Nitrososphaerota archaeon]
MLDHQKIIDLYSGKISIEALLSDPNLVFKDRVLINLINEGKKAGMTITEIKGWFINAVGSPSMDQSDKEVIEILEKLEDDSGQ